MDAPSDLRGEYFEALSAEQAGCRQVRSRKRWSDREVILGVESRGLTYEAQIAVEALALFIRFWLIVTPSLPESAQAAAQAKGRERYDSFLETLGRRLSKGQSLLREVSIDRIHDGAGQQMNSTATVQSRPKEAQQ